VVMLPALDRAERVTRAGVTGGNGRLSLSFDVGALFARLGELDINGKRPADVVAFLSLALSAGNLERELSFASGLLSPKGEDLLDQNARVSHALPVDFGKSIVGHVTDSSVRLWFNPHGDVGPAFRFRCEVEPAPPAAAPAPPMQEVQFDPGAARTAVVAVNGLRPATTYTYRLIAFPAGNTAAERTLAHGRFRTEPAAATDRLAFVFTSCNLPNTAQSLERWAHLARRQDYDFMLLIGDQIYGDDIEKLSRGDDWFERYENRYHQLWSYWPIREVMRRTPTLMIFDDHEIVDDFGTVPIESGERLAAGLRAYRLFQQAHGPIGATPDQHFYTFRKGPAAFFVMDGRSTRTIPPEGVSHPIFGEAQARALRAWATDPQTRAADVIFFVAPVPVAFLPVEELRRLIDKFIDEAGDTGAILGGLVGYAFLGPVGGALGAYVGHEVAEGAARGKFDAAGLLDLTSKDLADMWTFAPNQKEVVFLLDILFGLANDLQTDGSTGPRPRAVFVLGGDVHSGSMHLIASDRTRHARLPFILQVTSSPISKGPAEDKIYEKAVRHIRPGIEIGTLDFIKGGFDGEKIASRAFGEADAQFVLDDALDKHYAAEIIDFIAGRNFGQIEIERLRPDRRVYRFHMSVQGQNKSIIQFFDLDLDEPGQILPNSVIGRVLATEGHLSLLRAHEVGSGFGPSFDHLDAEVVCQLQERPGEAFGFKLRSDPSEPVRREMLGLLQVAFREDRRVRLDYRRNSKSTGEIIRVEVVE
jgi:PhoD-like phosphatase